MRGSLSHPPTKRPNLLMVAIAAAFGATTVPKQLGAVSAPSRRMGDLTSNSLYFEPRPKRPRSTLASGAFEGIPVGVAAHKRAANKRRNIRARSSKRN